MKINIDWDELVKRLREAANYIFARYSEDDTHIIEAGETMTSAAEEIIQMRKDSDWRG